MKKEYTEQAALLIETIPFIAKESCFALKGGTAINLFYRDMPRLSVDIDLSYIQFDDRNTAYVNINSALMRISDALSRAGFFSVVQGSGREKKIIVSNRSVSIKIEPNYTIRGYVYEPSVRAVSRKAEDEYGYAEIKTVSWPELFGGKMCAALDRQHPRDLFDIAGMLSGERLDENLMNGFIAMLLGHSRPVHELLSPVIKDQSGVFRKEFAGMTDIQYSYTDHVTAFEKLIAFLKMHIMPYQKFLLDFISLQADFSSVDIPNLDRLPAVCWKRQNLKRLQKENSAKFEEQYEKLARFFEEEGSKREYLHRL